MCELEDLKNWISEFKHELDKSSSELIFLRLTANHFKTRTQLKLLFSNEIDIMFNETELHLGAKALLLYQLEKLRNESPLPNKVNEQGQTSQTALQKARSTLLMSATRKPHLLPAK